MKKDTSKLVEELGLCPDFQTFYNENREYMMDRSLSELLCEQLDRRGLKKSQVIRASELSEVYAYQIFSGVRIPERSKLLCLAVALGLSLNVMLTGKHPGEQLAGGRAGRIVRKCTAISPDERYQTAAGFARAL